MAEIAVKLVIDKLIPLIAQEASLLKGVHREVVSIKDELESIACFLKEADVREAREDSNDTIKTWVKQVRDIAYCIEDIIDHYMHHVARRRNGKGVKHLLHKTGQSIRKLALRHEIASEIAEIKKEVLEVKSRADRYGLSNLQPGMMSSRVHETIVRPIASLFTEEADLVGIEESKDVLISWLLEKDQGAKRTVLSVVGMGGLGKTTLAKKVFDSQKGQFDCHAWITVSQIYSTKELIKKMIQQFYQASKQSAPTRIKDMDENRELIDELHSYVEQKRYVVVFDHVWSAEICEEMLYVLPENNKFSRIIFTTRREDVAPSRGESMSNRVYKLSTLTFKQSWQLFCKKVFQSHNGGFCPPELGKLSMDIVRKCDGLPLAIVTVGGVLSTKNKNVIEWKKFLNSLRTKLDSDIQLTRVTKILSLSYHDLPHHLKSCLLYVGIFPEDCSIRCSRLICQWIAESFVKVKNNEIVEDVAEEYLTELIHRSLIQVSEVDYSGKAREIRVHDMMREVIHLKSKELRFCQFLGGNASSDLDGKGRRLSILKNVNNDFSESVNLSIIRSFFVFQMPEFTMAFPRTLFEKFKLLKMLDFEDAPTNYLPECVGDLFHLSFLSIRNTKIQKLPKSIGNLQRLESLDFKRSLVLELPREIKKLCKLCHLLGYCIDESEYFSLTQVLGVKIQQGLGCAETLQKLSHVDANSYYGGTMIKELKTFRQLRKLGITNVRMHDVKELCSAIENLKQLLSLDISLMNSYQCVDFKWIVSPPPLLQSLALKGRLMRLPSWIFKLQM